MSGQNRTSKTTLPRRDAIDASEKPKASDGVPFRFGQSDYMHVYCTCYCPCPYCPPTPPVFECPSLGVHMNHICEMREVASVKMPPRKGNRTNTMLCFNFHGIFSGGHSGFLSLSLCSPMPQLSIPTPPYGIYDKQGDRCIAGTFLSRS